MAEEDTVQTLSALLTLMGLLGISPAQARGQLSQPAAKSTPKAPGSVTPAQARLVEAYGKLALSFEANQGQADPRVRFLARGSGYTFFLGSDEVVLALQKGQSSGKAGKDNAKETLAARHLPQGATFLRMRLVGGNPNARLLGSGELPGKSNYLVGNDPSRWRTDVENYARVSYQGVYPGVDLVYYGNQRQLEYDFVVAPGADPEAITVDIQAAKAYAPLRVDRNGDLIVETGDGEVLFQKPLVYQPGAQSGAGKPGCQLRVSLEGRYVLKGAHRVSFKVAGFDASKPLVIDPILSYSTYLGGSNLDFGRAIAVDAAGSAYVAGFTFSTDFPTLNAIRKPSAGGSKAFVAKLNAAGTALLYSTYLGGSGSDAATSIAVDASDNAYLTGDTTSADFPTLNAFQKTYSGNSDAFVSKLDAMGSALLYSTYLGGSNADEGTGIAVDAGGNAYVTGRTTSANFPTASPAQAKYAGNDDGFVTKLSSVGALVYSTYLGGSGNDDGLAIAVDPSGNVYVTGDTSSDNFPTLKAMQAARAGGLDAFVTKLDATGSLAYSTYLGGSGDDNGFGIAVDALGNSYVTGNTASSDFPTMNPQQAANAGGIDAFVAKLNPAGSLVYSTYLGGSAEDDGTGIAADKSGNAYVTGFSASPNFATMSPLQAANAGGFDAFVTKLDVAGLLVYSTYLGGSNQDFAFGIAVDGLGSAYVTGFTLSTDFPTANPLQAKNAGIFNVFVAKIASNAAPVVGFAPTSLTFGDQQLGTTSASQTVVVSNTGNATLDISGLTISGDFAQTNTCDPSLVTGATCNIDVAFTPTLLGSRTGMVTLSGNASGSPFSISLLGNGIDTIPPVVSISANPRTLWPPNRAMIPVTVSGTITDSGSGVNPSSPTFRVSDEYGFVQPSGRVTLNADGTYSFTVLLQASRNGEDLDGRRYVITVSAVDNAGNSASVSTGVTVPHDQRVAMSQPLGATSTLSGQRDVRTNRLNPRRQRQ